jgi:hypothetical protein
MSTFTLTFTANYYAMLMPAFNAQNFYLDGDIQTVSQTASLDTTILRVQILTDRSSQLSALLDKHEQAFIAILEG